MRCEFGFGVRSPPLSHGCSRVTSAQRRISQLSNKPRREGVRHPSLYLFATVATAATTASSALSFSLASLVARQRPLRAERRVDPAISATQRRLAGCDKASIHYLPAYERPQTILRRNATYDRRFRVTPTSCVSTCPAGAHVARCRSSHPLQEHFLLSARSRALEREHSSIKLLVEIKLRPPLGPYSCGPALAAARQIRSALSC